MFKLTYLQPDLANRVVAFGMDFHAEFKNSTFLFTIEGEIPKLLESIDSPCFHHFYFVNRKVFAISGFVSEKWVSLSGVEASLFKNYARIFFW